MARRGDNIYKRKDNRWEGRYKCGYKPDGSARYRSVYAKSYKAVKELLDTKRAEARIAAAHCTMSMAEVMRIWLCDARQRVKESTCANYEMKLNKHILPYFGKTRYDALTINKLNEFIAVKRMAGLSDKYIADIVVLLKSAARFMSKNHNCINRIEYAALPCRTKTAERTMLNAAQKKRLRDALMAQPDITNTCILLAAVTGLRIGELCALKRSDIDFDAGTLTVNRTVQRISRADGKGTRIVITAPKSRSSVRKIPLAGFIIPLLRRLTADKDAYLLSGGDIPTEPRTMQYRFARLLKKLGLPLINFHINRHMFATDCIEAGMDIKTLSEILGHSTVRITLDRYVHSSMERKIACMKMFSDKFCA